MNNFAERLKAARKMKGWSLQELADNLTLSISKQALHKYESGLMNPTSEVLISLSKVLGIKPDYFLRKSIELGPVEFRKKSKLSVKEIDSIKEKVKDFLERYLEVEQLLKVKVDFDNPVEDIVISNESQVDDIVLKVLKKWKLGHDPISNVVEMLEDNGVRVIMIDAPEAFDGLSTYVNNIPVVVISNQFTVERKRFTALHELGHLILKIAKGADKERICNAFAGAMLLPNDVLEKHLGEKRNNIAIGEIIGIREEFGISIQAAIMRAQSKGIVDRRVVGRFWKTFATNRKEAGQGHFRGNEKSYRFEHLVFRLAAEEVVSMSKAANLAGMSLADFRDKLDAV